jgi:hypothetical protein
VHNCHPAPQSPAYPKIARPPFPTKTVFDETKLSVDGRHPKTTTYGRKSLISALFDLSKLRTFPQAGMPDTADNRARWKIPPLSWQAAKRPARRH